MTAPRWLFDRTGFPYLAVPEAEVAVALWNRHLRHNPANPHWPNRDRFVLSNWHGSMLLYALLHLTGYDLPIEQIRQFRPRTQAGFHRMPKVGKTR